MKKSTRVINPPPMNGSGYDYIPTAEGNTLTDEQVASIGQTLYTRFYHNSRLPDYKSVMAENIRTEMEKRVRETLDCLKIKGFKVLPPIQ